MSARQGRDSPLRTRLLASGAAAATVAAGLAITAGAEGDIAKSTGDALYTVLVQTLVVAVAPRLKPAMAAGIAVGISWTVEVLQLTGVPSELSARSVLARLVLGSTFNPPDLFWYAVGAAFGWLIHTAVRSRRLTAR
jgi:hypothetical protein